MKTAIITGGGSGIGLAAARLLAQSAYRVGLVGRRSQALEQAVNSIQGAGGQAWFGALDVRDAPAVRDFVEATVRQYGKLDLLVNSAGVFKLASFEETDAALWEESLGANLTGAFNFCKAAWPHLGGGQIINISSVAGVQPFSGCAAYSASKYGLVGLSEVLALEGKSRGIRVHVLCPGNTETPIWEGQAPAEVQQRMMRPEEVAETIRWLALSPAGVSFDRVVMRPSQDPWKG